MPSFQRPRRDGANTIPSAVDWSGGYTNGGTVAPMQPNPVAIDINGSGQAALCAIGAMPLGLLQDFPKIGENARYENDGVLRYIAGAAITAGAKLTVGANGYLIPAAGGGGVVVAKALYAANQGDISTCEYLGYAGTV